ncbi:MAG: type IV pilin-like G/H family protein [Xenococcaceae cyanobacterium]
MLTILLVLVGSIAWFELPGCACGRPSYRGKWGVYSLLINQLNYHQKNQTFANSFESLQEIGAIPNRYQQSFQFSVQTTPTQALVSAIPLKTEVSSDLFRLGLRKEQFRTVVGAIAFSQGEYFLIICESSQGTTTHPATPMLKDGGFTCPSRFKELRSFRG